MTNEKIKVNSKRYVFFRSFCKENNRYQVKDKINKDANTKFNHGITLISLVITIIILIILAGVSINLTIGKNGLINKTKEAKEKTQVIAIIEKIQTNIVTKQLENQGNITDIELDAILEMYDKEGKSDRINTNGERIIETEEGYVIKVAEIFNGMTQAIYIADENVKYLYNNTLPLIQDYSITKVFLNNITKEAMLSNDIIMDNILAIESNIDYILNNKDVFLDEILKSEIAVKRLANNIVAKEKIKQNSDWISRLEGCDYAYEPWTQPKMTSNVLNTPEGNITITAIGTQNSWHHVWDAMDGKSSDGEGGYWWYYSSPAWWQVEFSYKLRIKKIDFYNQYSTSNDNKNLKEARLYTDSTRKTPIGNSFSANSNWQHIAISGITENEIITNKIYFYKTSGGAGIGELVITADKFLFS